MKVLLVVAAGLADEPIAELDGKTPLDRARTPHLDHLAARGILGLTRTIARGDPLDQDAGLLAALGHPPAVHVAAGVLEALGRDVALDAGDVAFRCDLVGLEAGPDGRTLLREPAALADGDAGRALVAELAAALGSDALALHPGAGHRHVLVWRGGDDRVRTRPPFTLLGKPIEGLLPDGPGAEGLRALVQRSRAVLGEHPACRQLREQGVAAPDALWPWGAGRRVAVEPLTRLGVAGGFVAGAPHAVAACRLGGLARVPLAGATGWLDTDLRAKAAAALAALERQDLVVIHVEAPNAAAALGDAHRKLAAIERLDEELLGALLEGLRQRGGPWRLLLTSDHAAPCALRGPSSDPVPFAVYVSDDEQKARGVDRGFSERDARDQGIFIPEAHGLLERLCRRAAGPAREA
jgi:2,3-bisphosphoglycerate-independent phosphoglycerate mutase